MPNTDHVDPKTVRFWAMVDSGILALALPPTAKLFLGALYLVNGWLGGESAVPEFGPLQEFFLCLSGAMVALWVIVRLLRPLGVFALIDGVGRIWVAGLIVYYVVLRRAPEVLWFFVFTELAGSVAQLRACYARPRLRLKPEPSAPS